MIERERIELLKQVAECAPKEWDIERSGSGDDLALCCNGYGWLSLDSGDRFDCLAIIDMLDAMEGVRDDLYVSMFSHPANGCRTYSCAVCNRDALEINARGEGTTRAEAVARAFVAVFGGGK